MRNHFRFHQRISIVSAINMVKDYIQISGNMSKKCTSNHMDDFFVLFFDISTRLGMVSVHVQVYWDFRDVSWTKVDTEGATRGSPGPAACAGIFRERHGEYIRVFLLFWKIRMSCMLRSRGLFLPLNMLGGLGSESFGWRVILLCSIKLFLLPK